MWRDDTSLVYCRHPIQGLPATQQDQPPKRQITIVYSHTSKQTRRTLHHAPAHTIRSDAPLRELFIFRPGGVGERYHSCEVRLFDSGGSFEAVVDGGGKLNLTEQVVREGSEQTLSIRLTGSAGMMVPDCCWVVAEDMVL